MCAERSQIVHRDVKAPNVLLREVESRWDVCISDFGTPAAALSLYGLGSNHAKRRRSLPLASQLRSALW